jgi:hypothetical protein
MPLCFQIAGEEYCVEIDTRKIARLVVGRYDPGGKDPEVPNAGEDGLKIRWSDGIYVFKNVKCRRGCGPGDTDCAHREHVEITALGDRIIVQTAPGATHPVYYGRAETERNVLKEILLTPGQRLYLWISGVRDAAGRQPNNPLRNTSPRGHLPGGMRGVAHHTTTLPPRRERPSKTHGKRGRRPQARIRHPQRTPRWSNNHQPRAGKRSKTIRGCGRTYGTPHKGGNSRGG